MSDRTAISSAIFRPAGPNGTRSIAMSCAGSGRATGGHVADLASRVAGSSDIFGYRGRRPWASINFITAHDGFTLQDLVSYNDKHNEANGEDNRDGHDANFSWNCGDRGPDRRPQDHRAARPPEAQSAGEPCWSRWACRCWSLATRSGARNTATTTPIARTTRSPGSTGRISAPKDQELCAALSPYLIHLRRRHRVFSRPRFLRGEVLSEAGVKDITWLTPGRRGSTERGLEQSGGAVASAMCWAARPASSIRPADSAISTRVFS